METKIVEEKSLGVKLTVAGPSNVKMGMRRTFLINQEQAKLRTRDKDGTEQDDTEIAAEALLRTIYYPAFIAGTIKQEGFDHWPISSDEFIELPETFLIEWEKVIYILNPHWAQIISTDEEAEEAEKKAMKPSKKS